MRKPRVGTMKFELPKPPDGYRGEEISLPAARLARALVEPGNRRLVYVSLALLAACRLAFQFGAAPFCDEAYYWLWGLHPSLSYYDHPPLDAWLLGLAVHLFGWNLFGLRAITLATTVGTMAVLVILSRKLTGALGRDAGPVACAIFLASPLMFIYTTLVYHDHLSIFLSFVSLSLFAAFFTGVSSQQRPELRWLYLAAFALGLAVLTKYNAVFVGLGAAAAVVTVPALRPLLRNPHLYAAAAVSVLMQAPVFYWNAANGQASFRYNLYDRLHVVSPSHVVITLVGVIGTSVAILSPLLLPAFFRSVTARIKPLPLAIWQSLGAWTFACSTAAMLFLCFFIYVHFYWNIIAYLFFFPVAAIFFGSIRLLRAYLIYGIVGAALFVFNYTVMPLSALVGPADLESSRSYGWDELAARIAAAKAASGAAFVAASSYQSTSLAGFALHEPEVLSLDTRPSQFDIWSKQRNRQGQDAIVLVEEPQVASLDRSIRPHFRTLDLIAMVPIVRFGKTLTTYSIYHGAGYR
ncbi:MAG TPA: glycosyltransferase family 39 protein [Xanthobacteraceae bacterium]|nr:glycosyltransferase family 39 protein [Xanthobacteraceae bacterium]